MRRISKLMATLSFALILAVAFGITDVVLAAEPENDVSYSVNYSSEEVTNFYALLDRAINKPQTRGASSYELSVIQLLEIREYDNGFIEKDYAVTNFALNAEMARKAGVIQQGDPTWNSHTLNDIKDYSVSCTLYYTARLYGESILSAIIEYQVSKVTGSIVKTNVTSVTITEAELGYVLDETSWKNTYLNYNNAAGTGGQNFTLTCSDRNWYPCGNPDWLTFYKEGLGGYIDVYASDGSSARIITMPKEA